MDDGMLSQDEINALLMSMDLSGNVADSSPAPEPIPEPEPVKADSFYTGSEPLSADQALLTDVEKDAIGEIANISMGSSATTLYSLVNRKVNITTPVVTLSQWSSLMTEYEKPCVFIQIRYTQGLDGTNILVLRENDVKIITDLMMGGDGTNTDGELGELHLSAISEAMNQMMGSAATSLSTMLGTVIDISPPDANLLNLTEIDNAGQVASFLSGTFVKIEFRMQIGELVDSTIMQLYPVEFARKIVDTFIGVQMPSEPEPVAQETPVAQSTTPYNEGHPSNQTQAEGSAPFMNVDQQMGMNPQMMGMEPQMMGMNPQMMGMNQQMMGMNQQMMGMNPQMMGMSPYGYPMGMAPQMMQQGVNVQPAQFQSFDANVNAMASQENIGLIRDVPLEVTVELGRTTKSIADILDFAPGTIIELDRIAGEPIDVLVNGKFVAKGEVVVIEESFGIRVTEIIK